MRKIVFLLVLILSIVACGYVATEGLDSNFLQIASYSDVKSANKQLETQISELNRKNSSEFESKKTALNTAVKNYKDKKEQYEALAPTVNTNTENEEPTTTGPMPYDIDFLWTIVGNYATEEGVTIDFTSTKSTSSLTSSSEVFTMADLNFNISGAYNSVIEFIYDIEDDDRLEFEISSFKMQKGGDGVQATFVVKSIPINNDSITTLDATSNTNGADSAAGTTTEQVPGGNNTVTPGTPDTTAPGATNTTVPGATNTTVPAPTTGNNNTAVQSPTASTVNTASPEATKAGTATNTVTSPVQ